MITTLDLSLMNPIADGLSQRATSLFAYDADEHQGPRHCCDMAGGSVAFNACERCKHHGG